MSNRLSHFYIHDDGLVFQNTSTSDDKPAKLFLASGEGEILANEVIGSINFQAQGESDGADANLVCATLEAVAEGDFTATSNATKLSFKTGNSEAASERMVINSSGNVGIGTNDPKTKFSVLGDISFANHNRFLGFNTGYYDSAWRRISGTASYSAYLKFHGDGALEYVNSPDSGNGGDIFSNQKTIYRISRTGHFYYDSTSPQNVKMCLGTNDDQKGRLTVTSYATRSGTFDPDSHAAITTRNSNGNWWSMAVDSSDDFQFWAGGDLRGFLDRAGGSGQLNFTGQHRCLMNSNTDTSKEGLIVSATNNIINVDNGIKATINESLPYCVIASSDYDTRIFGVISGKEDTGDGRSYASGNFVSAYQKENSNEERLYINSVGEGGVWVCNKNGALNAGDYIVSSSVVGYGMKQTTDAGILKNYTVAKITSDCGFSLTKIVKQKLKTVSVTETKQRIMYQDVTESVEKTVVNYDVTLDRYVQTTVTEEVTKTVKVTDTHDLYDEQGNIIGTHETDRMENYDVTTQEIDYDANGDVQYEDDLDEQGNQQLVYPLETRFLDANGNLLVDEADYNTRLGNGESVYIACFVGCTYHCG